MKDNTRRVMRGLKRMRNSLGPRQGGAWWHKGSSFRKGLAKAHKSNRTSGKRAHNSRISLQYGYE